MSNDWIEHNGEPQPVGDDVWVELDDGVEGPYADLAGKWGWEHERYNYRILNQHLIDAKQAEIDALQHEVMWLHNALEQTEEAVVYGYTLLDDMDAKIDAARLEGIRLGLEAANKAVEALVSAGDLHIEEESALEDASIAIRNLNPDTIAREAQDMGSEKEAKDD